MINPAKLKLEDTIFYFDPELGSVEEVIVKEITLIPELGLSIYEFEGPNLIIQGNNCEENMFWTEKEAKKAQNNLKM